MMTPNITLHTSGVNSVSSSSHASQLDSSILCTQIRTPACTTHEHGQHATHTRTHKTSRNPWQWLKGHGTSAYHMQANTNANATNATPHHSCQPLLDLLALGSSSATAQQAELGSTKASKQEEVRVNVHVAALESNNLWWWWWWWWW
jgi:hypothetical protein